MQYNLNTTKNFTMAYNRMVDKYGEEFANLNGVSERQLSNTDFLDAFAGTSTVADVSVDSSANVGHKDVVTLLSEMSKPEQKLMAMHKIYYEMNKKYGYKAANEWFEANWNKALYMHDENTSSFKPYCYAYDLTRLAEEGLFFLRDEKTNFNYKPAKHLPTFIDFVREFVHYTSNRTSGACGLPNLIPYMYYFWSRDVESGYCMIDPEKYAKQSIQVFIYLVNQNCVRDGIQSAFTNTSIFDREYLMALFGGAVFPDGKFMVDELEGIMRFQKWFLEEKIRITREENTFTFPVNSISLIRKDGKFADEEFAEWAIKTNMEYSDSNLFIDENVTSLSNCCRLKSNIEDLGYFNSIGGSALRVGSVKVSTINLARIAYECNTEVDYLARLKEMVKLDLKALDVQRHIIQRNIEKGFLPNYCDGLIDISTQYSTVGVIGVYETLKSFGYTHEDKLGNTYYDERAFLFGKAIFDTIHAEIKEFTKDKDYMVNIEQIPGESAASKMQKADTILYPDKVIDDLPLYGNQFIPLGIKTTLAERVKIASAFDSYCNGGSILHINIDKPFTNFEDAMEMVNYVADAGVTYFAFNTKINACKNNHGFYGSKCPICGEPVDVEYTRIVGFYTPIKTWSKERKEEYKLREWMPLADKKEALGAD